MTLTKPKLTDRIAYWFNLDRDRVAALTNSQLLEEIEIAYRFARLSVGEQLENAMFLWRTGQITNDQFQSECRRLDEIHDVYQQAMTELGGEPDET